MKMPDGIAGRIQTELDKVAKEPAEYSGDWKKLKGSPFWRLRVGNWRAICEVVKKELIVYVLKIGSRGDIYK